MTSLAVPDVWSGGVTIASAEDVDGAIASVAIHGCMRAVDMTTNEAWGFFVE